MMSAGGRVDVVFGVKVGDGECKLLTERGGTVWGRPARKRAGRVWCVACVVG